MTDAPSFSIRRLGPGDEAVLATLASNDADFDLDGRGAPLSPLAAADARAFLAHPAVLHWAAFDAGEVIGFLLCHLLPMRSGPGRELLLYEIGVHARCRRRGVGRALLGAMEREMRAQRIGEAWVLADNAVAARFYRACGYRVEEGQPLYLTREVEL